MIHSAGRAEAVDRHALARPVASNSRFLNPHKAIAAARTEGEIDVLESRRLGGAWVLNRLWERLGIGAAAAPGRRRPAPARGRPSGCCSRGWRNERWKPGSKLAATQWVGERFAIAGCGEFCDDAAYRAMDFLLDALGEIAARMFASVAHLLNLDVDILFVDSSANRGG